MCKGGGQKKPFSSLLLPGEGGGGVGENLKKNILGFFKNHYNDNYK